MSSPIKFTQVKRQKCKASILLMGTPGSGKSTLALRLANALSNNQWEKVFACDTEAGSLKLLDGLSYENKKFEKFNVFELDDTLGYRPTIFEEMQNVAIENGAEVIIQDSLSHAWQGTDGVLDIVSKLKETITRYQKDSYASWSNPEVMKEKQTLAKIMRNSKAHIISCARAKEKLEYTIGDDGKTKLQSLGEQAILQEGIAFEPDLCLLMIEPGSDKKAPKALVRKSRYAILSVGETYEFTDKLCQQIREYLDKGVSPEEIQQQQKDEYVKGITEFLNTHADAKPLWKQLKADKNLANKKLEEISLQDLKELFVLLTV